MTTIPDEAPALTKPRRRWWRFFVQFSLRSLLIVTTLAGVGCWWFLQPETREEELAGKHLKLRRQVTLVPRDETVVLKNITGDRDDLMAISVGSWRLIDQHGDPLVVGRYQKDVPHGKWTVYHVNGRKAAEGQVVRGAKNGLWRVWDVVGRLQSEVTYLAVEVKVGSDGSRARGFIDNVIPVVGTIGPLGQLGGGGGGAVLGGSGKGMGGGMMMGNFMVPPQPQPQAVSERHGPARVWYPTGKLRFEGQYVHDRKDGRWTHYDEQGRTTDQGEYQQDWKEGIWKEEKPNAAGRGPEIQKVEYVAGRPRADHDALVARLRADLLEGGSLRARHEAIARYVAAVERLEGLGRHGTPLLLEALDRPDADLKVLAVRTLERIVAQAAITEPPRPLDVQAILAKVEPLMAVTDSRLRTHALLIVYRQKPSERARLLPKLLEAVIATSDPEWQQQALRTIFALEPERSQAIFPTLAIVAEAYLKPEPAGQFGRWFQYEPYGFIALAEELKDLDALLIQQSLSRDPAVRWFVLAVVGDLTYRELTRQVSVTGGGKATQLVIPEPYRELVERLKGDPDTAVREAADRVGQPFGTGGGLQGGMY